MENRQLIHIGSEVHNLMLKDSWPMGHLHIGSDKRMFHAYTQGLTRKLDHVTGPTSDRLNKKLELIRKYHSTMGWILDTGIEEKLDEESRHLFQEFINVYTQGTRRAPGRKSSHHHLSHEHILGMVELAAPFFLLVGSWIIGIIIVVSRLLTSEPKQLCFQLDEILEFIREKSRFIRQQIPLKICEVQVFPLTHHHVKPHLQATSIPSPSCRNRRRSFF